MSITEYNEYSNTREDLERFARFESQPTTPLPVVANVNCIDGRHAVVLLSDGRLKLPAHPAYGAEDNPLSIANIRNMQAIASMTGGEPLRCRCLEILQVWQWIPKFPRGKCYTQLEKEHPWLYPAVYNRLAEDLAISPSHFLSLLPEGFRDAARAARDRAVYRHSLFLSERSRAHSDQKALRPFAERIGGNKKKLLRTRMLHEIGKLAGIPISVLDHYHLPKPVGSAQWLRRVPRSNWFKVFRPLELIPVSYPSFRHWPEGIGFGETYPPMGVCFRYTPQNERYSQQADFRKFWFSLELSGGEYHMKCFPVKD